MISAMNFKSFDRGSMKGFFDLRYHGLTIKGCRLMSGSNGLWVALPQRQGEKDDETQYLDIMFLTPPEAEHVRQLAVADLQAQGHIHRAQGDRQVPQQGRNTASDGEGLSGKDDDIRSNRKAK